MRRALPSAVLLLTLTAGCGEPTPDTGGRTAHNGESPQTAQRSFDPPLKFDVAKPVTLPDDVAALKVDLGGNLHAPLPVVGVGTKLFVATQTGLGIIDLTSGGVTSLKPAAPAAVTAPPPRAFAGTNPVTPPVLATIDGKPVVLTAVLVNNGTAAEVIAVDPDAGKSLWSMTVPASVPAGIDVAQYLVQIVGVSGATAVVRTGTDTVQVDLAARKPGWQKKGFAATAVADNTVVGWTSKSGGSSYRAAAFGLADGGQRWADQKDSSGLVVVGAGPKHAMVSGKDYSSGKAYYRLVEAASGRAVDEDSAGSITYDLDCAYDSTATTVCWMDNWVSAFDPTNGKWLWEQPDKNGGKAPRVTAVWHGAVYGTVNGKPVVLDAKTGAVRQADPGVAPFVVTGSYGIAENVATHGLAAYRSIG
jgi:hypothetical protein